MHIGAKLLQPLLMDDAEALFLVNDHEAEALELQPFGEQRMGADHHVNGACRQPFLGRLRLGGWDEAGEAADVEREACKALHEIAVMLAGKQGGGAYEHNLKPGHRRDEGGA